jgi:hypothetical protein
MSDKLYGANDRHWLTEAPLDYLKEGDRFVLRKLHSYDVATGVADMDGHSVSEHYGFRDGNDYYIRNPKEDYVNVRWDGIEYSKKGSHDFKLPLNHSVYNKDGTVYVSKKIAARVALDQEQNTALRNGKALQAEEMARGNKKAELLAQVAVIQKKIKEL